MGAVASKKFIEGDTVRIVALNRITRTIAGSEGVLRQPRIGEEGEVIRLEPSLDPVAITVDHVENGLLIWSATFEPAELERVVGE